MSKQKDLNMKATLYPELPRDMPMPVFRYQRDEPSVRRDKLATNDAQKKAASLLAGLNLMGCASNSNR